MRSGGVNAQMTFLAHAMSGRPLMLASQFSFLFVYLSLLCFSLGEEGGALPEQITYPKQRVKQNPPQSVVGCPPRRDFIFFNVQWQVW